jgi:antitoxin component of RelBE/YafQ-DinJ toxin-antitoxin module
VDENIKMMGIDLEATVRDNFKAACYSNGKTMSEVVQNFVKQYIDENKSKDGCK